ncbi:MAG: ATP-binding protein [Cyclobacteriaceae bacterium]
MNSLNRTLSFLTLLGVNAKDGNDLRARKNLLVYLAIFMSMGGLVWGTLLVSFGLKWQSVYPYGYIIISFINIATFNLHRNFKAARTIQISISMLLPFFLQWSLGGFYASGVVVLWATLALIGSITLSDGRAKYSWLFLYVVLIAFSFIYDSDFLKDKPEMLTPSVSLMLLVINLSTIMCIVYVLAKIKVDQDNSIQRELKKAYIHLNDSKEQLQRTLDDLKYHQSRLEEAQRISRVGSFDVDLKNKTEYWSKEMYAILSVDAKDPSPSFKIFTDQIIPEDREFRSNNSVDNSPEQEFKFLVRIKKPNGQLAYIEEKGLIIKNEHGDNIRIQGTLQDVTQQKETEETLTKSKRLAEEATKAKSEFLANMSHELRTPMNSILGFSQLLKGKLGNERFESYINHIINGGKNLLLLISDILDLSKIESGKAKPENSIIDLFEFIEELKINFQLRETAEIEFKVDLQEDLPTFIIIDASKLRQIANNLLDNAFKFTDQGSVILKVSHSISERKLHFSISDTGIGIPLDQHEKIFDAFVQQDGQSTRKYGGSGLGLAITKKLVSIMSGTITMKSKPGAGSSFEVSIPFEEVIAENRKNENSAKNMSDTFKRKILIVEDDNSNRLLMREIITTLGDFDVVEAVDGESALQFIGLERPDLIIMDIMMPRMNGYEVNRRLKDDASTASIPVVAWTATGLKDEEIRLRSEFNALMRKPSSMEEITNTLSQFLSLKSSTRID